MARRKTLCPRKKTGLSTNANLWMSEVQMPINNGGINKAGSHSEVLQALLRVDHRFFQLVVNQRDIKDKKDNMAEEMLEGFSSAVFSSDIKELANVYCYALFEIKRFKELPKLEELSGQFSSTDLYAAHDLIWKMATEVGFSLKDVLMHPFHWSIKEKVDFICQAFDMINLDCNFKDEPKIRKKTEEAANRFKLEGSRGEVFDVKNGWLKQLKLYQDELRNISRKNRGSKDTICDSTLKEGKTSYDDNSLLSLMRFFRNYHVHYWEKNIQVREAFGGFYEGYWKFFNRRFPRFFMYVYERMKEFMPQTTNFVAKVDMLRISPG